MTDDATNGRPWPIDPSIAPPPEAGPVPELVVDGVPDLLASFADRVDDAAPTAETEPASPTHASSPPASSTRGPTTVDDDDRNVYGVLLDRAAERGLLSQSDYEVRLGELAAATSVEQMRRIVTDLPAFGAPPPAPSAHRSKRATPTVAPDMALVTVGGRRRSSPWVLLAILVVVVLASLAFFSIYAEHLVHNHDVGLVSTTAVVRMLSAPRL